MIGAGVGYHLQATKRLGRACPNSRFHLQTHFLQASDFVLFLCSPCLPVLLCPLSPEPEPWLRQIGRRDRTPLLFPSRQDTQGCYKLNGGVETIGLANNCLSATVSVFSVIIAFNTASYWHKRASGSSNFHWGLFRNAQAHHLVLILLACQNWS